MLIIIISATITGILLFLLWKNNHKSPLKGLTKAGPSKKNGKRHFDKNKLTPYQKRIYKQAKSLLKQGRHANSAQLLESIGLHRQAIELLEQSNNIREAAAMLMRMQLPGRAAAIFKRNKMLFDAAECYKIAGQPEEEALCALEIGDGQRAAKCYMAAGKPDTAAKCFAQTGNIREACKLYAQSKNMAETIKLLNQLLEKTLDISKLNLTPDEIDIATKFIMVGNTNPRLADVVVFTGKTMGVLNTLIKACNPTAAAELYKRNRTDINDQLLSQVLSAEQSITLAEMFKEVNNFEYAGKVYQRLDDFVNAGKSYRQASSFGIAAECFDRAGMKNDYQEMVEKAEVHQTQIPHGHQNLQFVMNDLSQTNSIAASDHTSIIENPDTVSSALVEHRRSLFKISNDDITQASEVDQDFTKLEYMPTAKLVPQTSAQVKEDPHPKIGDNNHHTMDQKRSQDTPKNMTTIPLSEGSSGFSSEEMIKLRNCNLWQGTQPHEIESFINLGKLIEYKLNQTVIGYQQDPKGLFIIIEGHISSEDSTLLKPGDWLGHREVLLDAEKNSTWVTTEPVRAMLIPTQDLTVFMDKNPTFAAKVYRMLAISLL